MALRKIFIAALFVVLTATVANAYTIVMRDGRKIEIPNEFTVTKTTLTYEVGSGIQITVQLSGVDIPATERANSEKPGAFLAKASAPRKITVPPAQASRPAQRSITNRDLESFRRKRLEEEAAYERRRRELGLPTAEERRREIAEIEDRTQETLLRMQEREQNSEAYWRSRSSSLRTEIVANQAQMDYVRRRLDEIPPSYSFGAFTTTIPFGTVGAPFINFPFQGGLTPNVFAPSLVTGFGGFGATIGINNRHFNNRQFHNRQFNNRHFNNRRFDMRHRRPSFPSHRGRFNRGHFRGGFSPFFGGNLLAIPFESGDYNFEVSELVSQLNELEMNHAALTARWRELEEEARRAGAYPGWLR